MHNLNRVFPGGGEGFFTHRLAEVLVAHFLDKLDYYIDLHAGGAYGTVDYVYVGNAETLSRAFGSAVLFRPPQGYGYGGSTAHYMTSKGVPCVTVELGGGAVDQAEYVRRGIAGITNVLRTVGMFGGSPSSPPRQTVLRTLVTLRPTAGGMLIPEATALHAVLQKDAVLGRVVSPYAFDELDVFRAPFERSLTVLVRPTVCRVQPGEFGYMIGDLGTAE
jgi:predicted deacylase